MGIEDGTCPWRPETVDLPCEERLLDDADQCEHNTKDHEPRQQRAELGAVERAR